MTQGLQAVEKMISKAAMACAIAAIFLIMVIGTADVLAQFLASPLPFKLELSEVLFAFSIFLAWPSVQSQRMHISVDVFSKSYSSGFARFINVLSDLISLVVFGLITFTIWRMAIKSVALRETASGFVNFPIYPFKVFCAIGATLTVIVLLIHLLRGSTAIGREEGLTDGGS